MMTSIAFLNDSGVLRNARIAREEFNPLDVGHQRSLRHFLETGNWGAIQFFPEAPYISVPETVLRKMAIAGLVALGQ